MHLAGLSAGEWLLLVQYELLLFAGLFFFIGALDELAMDACWLWLRLRGRIGTHRLPAENASPDSGERSPSPLAGPVAVLIPAWDEAAVLPLTVRHLLRAWPYRQLALYVGCYRNDTATITAMLEQVGADPRLRLVIHSAAGPTTKADCLNRLYRALDEDERRSGAPFRMVVLHDAEDMVDPRALELLDRAIDQADFVQLPVLPAPQQHSRWIGSHYCEEFAEAHGKAMVVRDALGAALPSAGVGCALAREQLAALARERPDGLPFDANSLTEDYQLGMSVARAGGRMRFLRARGDDGALVATRACFPDTLVGAVRQKTRWLHGIAFQSWERLGWSGSLVENWMQMRDRRGPFSAFLLAVAYLLVILSGAMILLGSMGLAPALELTPLLRFLLIVNLANLLWRAGFRFAFTVREYGLAEGARSVLRIPIANIIAIMAGRRAFIAYLRALRGREVRWEKTAHYRHPARVPVHLEVAPA